ncbi:Thoeris anti-defense Tad2 family protein [Xenorhabdus stockiae]|uniref:Thoeris anti-defense Tad2 family protein n=1 Tax=Xenorhabdus stockiae TaxID=351614 RepID=UPI004062B4F5
MSDVNKLDQYEFDNDNTVVWADPGSFAWAINKIFLGGKVSRASWSMLNKYMSLAPETGVRPYIIKTEDGVAYPWNPSPEELNEYLRASDWKSECMLSFDLNIGTIQYYNGNDPDNDKVQEWGYSIESEDRTYGVLTNLQSTIGVGSIVTFKLIEVPIGTFWGMELKVDTQNQPDLGIKNLEVIVNGSTYNLGSIGPITPPVNRFLYISDGAKQLGDLIKQNKGKTLFFCFNWK